MQSIMPKISVALTTFAALVTGCTAVQPTESVVDPTPIVLVIAATKTASLTNTPVNTEMATPLPAPMATSTPEIPLIGYLAFDITGRDASYGPHTDIILIDTQDRRVLRLDGWDVNSHDQNRFQHPLWSPGGESLSYLDGFQVFVADPDGSNPRKITDIPEGVFYYFWNADGMTLTLVVDVTPITQTVPEPKLRYFEVGRDGLGLVQVGKTAIAEPDYTSIIWQDDRPAVYTRDANGEAVELHLTERVLVGSIASPIVASTDGRYLAFVATCRRPGFESICPVDVEQGAQAGETGLVVFDTALGSAKLLSTLQTPDPKTTPTWSPDGQWIAVATGNSQDPTERNVVAVRSDGLGEVLLWSSADNWRGPSYGVAISYLAWQPGP